MIAPERILVARNWSHLYPPHQGRALIIRRSTLRAQAAGLLSIKDFGNTPRLCTHDFGKIVRDIHHGFHKAKIFSTPLSETKTATLFIFADKSCALGILNQPIPTLKSRTEKTQNLGTITFIPLIFTLTNKACENLYPLTSTNRYNLNAKTRPGFDTLVIPDILEAIPLLDAIGPFVHTALAQHYCVPVAPWCETLVATQINLDQLLAGCIIHHNLDIKRAMLAGGVLNDQGQASPISIQAYTGDTFPNETMGATLYTHLQSWLDKKNIKNIDTVAFHYSPPIMDQPGGKKASIQARYFQQHYKSGHEKLKALQLYAEL